MKEQAPTQQVLGAAIKILDYLRLHPSAKDSISGIANWWVGEKPEFVAVALEILIKEGIVERQKVVYRLATKGEAFDYQRTIEHVTQRLKN